MRFTLAGVLSLFSLLPGVVGAEDNRNRYPFGLANSYVEIGLGHINYPFSENLLNPGYRVESIQIPHAGVRLGFGHNFNHYLSAQITYARPVKWVRYEGVSGSDGKLSGHSVLTNVAGLTVRTTAPVAGPLSFYFEGGLGIITHSGFKVDGVYAVNEVNYRTVLVGTGLKLRLNNKWDLQAGVNYSPANDKFNQPRTVIFSGGGVLNMRNSEAGSTRASSRRLFPRNLVQFGYSTNRFGTGVNHLVSGKIPIFWGGNAHVEQGFMLLYQRNIFNPGKVFSFDVGASVSRFRSERDGTDFSAVALFPQFKFTPIRTGCADIYLTYSLAGPAYLTPADIDGIDTGRHFTFQDLMGLGMYLGKGKRVNAEVRIGHYSNGNLFPRNPGVKVPLTFNLGFAF